MHEAFAADQRRTKGLLDSLREAVLKWLREVESSEPAAFGRVDQASLDSQPCIDELRRFWAAPESQVP